ncbi:hypothetical protein HZA39_01190 [Candidatus Peregrinibacteria bacterium]|nr:hypothetical protein [Candidatus Peregrinibacteria bacterium]
MEQQKSLNPDDLEIQEKRDKIIRTLTNYGCKQFPLEDKNSWHISYESDPEGTSLKKLKELLEERGFKSTITYSPSYGCLPSLEIYYDEKNKDKHLFVSGMGIF